MAYGLINTSYFVFWYVCVTLTGPSIFITFICTKDEFTVFQKSRNCFFSIFFLHILNNLIVIKLFFFIIPLFLLPLGYKLNTMKLLITRLNVRITRNTTFRVKKEKNALRTCLRYMLSRFYIFLSFSRY